MATPTTSDFLVVPINGTDLIAFYRGSNISRPLYLSYTNFLAILTQAISGGTKLLLETNSVKNQSQAILNLIQGAGITITDGGNGNITIAATGGTAFITSISDTADIDLDVTLSDLTATLTTTGVTPNTYGNATQVPQITVDSKGRITGVTLVNITAGTGTVTSVATAGLISGGPITVSGTITTSMNTNKLVGRGAAGAGIMQEITLGTNLSLSGTTLNATGGGVTGVTATSPITSSGGAAPDISTSMNTNKIIGRYDVGIGVMQEVSVGAGLSISGSSLIATGSASGGSSISYYLNGGTAASVATYYQMSKTAVVGTNADFNKAGNGLITQWLTDVGDPNRIEIPAGNWNFEIFMSASSAGGTPAFYVELLKYNGAFTTIANSSAAPENITGVTSIDLYLTSLAIPYTPLLATDRLAIRVYIVNSVPGRTITMHTQDSHLCQVVTNFAGGIVSINGVGANTQFLTTGTTGTAFNIDSTSIADTHKFNIPLASTASVTAGLISKAEFDVFSAKLSTTLNNTNIFVGNISNVATGVAMTGDTTIANTGAVTIANNAVTYAKMQNASAIKKLLGSSSTTTAVQEITLGSGLTLTGTTLTAGGLFQLIVAASDETTALTTGTAKVTFRMPRAVTLTSVRASLTAFQTSGSILTVDINESGTSILSTKITIDNGEKTSTTAVTSPVISDVNLADDAEMTIDINQIGSGTAKGLKVYLIGDYA